MLIHRACNALERGASASAPLASPEPLVQYLLRILLQLIQEEG